MDGFLNASQAKDVMTAVFNRIDLGSLRRLCLVYSYRFTDLDWSFTVIVQEGRARMVDGILPESETTIETTSAIFHRVMTGRMNVIFANLTNQARFRGSVGNVFKLRALFPSLSEAYRAAIGMRD